MFRKTWAANSRPLAVVVAIWHILSVAVAPTAYTLLVGSSTIAQVLTAFALVALSVIGVIATWRYAFYGRDWWSSEARYAVVILLMPVLVLPMAIYGIGRTASNWMNPRN